METFFDILSRWGMQDPSVKTNVFYDESNNYRKVCLKEGKLNIREDNNFVIAGITDDNDRFDYSLDDLKEKIGIHQGSITEIKAKHIFTGDFLDAIESPKMLSFMKFIEEQKYPVHISTVNILHWVAIDIVESVMEQIDMREIVMSLQHEDVEMIEKLYGIPPMGSFDIETTKVCLMNYAQRKQVSLLLDLIRCDRQSFVDLLAKHNIPRVSDPKGFIRDLRDLYFRNKDKIDVSLTITESDELFFEKNFCEKHAGHLQYIQIGESNELISKFLTFYMYVPQHMIKCTHYFDNENTIQESFMSLQPQEFPGININFLDSKDDLRIQISDVLAGFFAKFSTFIDNNTTPFLIQTKKGLSKQANEVLSLLKKALIRSDALSPALSIRIDSFHNCVKANMFLN